MSTARHVGRMAVTFQLLEFHLQLAPGSIYDVRRKGSGCELYVEHESLPLHDARKLPPMVARATLVSSAPEETFESDVLAALAPEDPHEHDLHRLDDDGAPHT